MRTKAIGYVRNVDYMAKCFSLAVASGDSSSWSMPCQFSSGLDVEIKKAFEHQQEVQVFGTMTATYLHVEKVHFRVN